MKPGRGRRQAPARESVRQPPSTPQLYTGGRDSDASFCSTRPPSSVGLSVNGRAVSITDNAYKQSAVRVVNGYLANHNVQFYFSLKSIPSAKDITEVFRFIFSRLGFSFTDNRRFEDDLPLLMKYLNCPHKINKSALRAPGTPHAFPFILAVMHWLVQLAECTDHVLSDENSRRYAFMNDTLAEYALSTYFPFMNGDDEAVESLDRELDEKMEKQIDLIGDSLNLLTDEENELELELEALKSNPSEREVYESQCKDLEGDLSKFEVYIAELRNANSITNKALEETEKELAVKVEEIRQIREENEDIKKKVESQGINLRDAERMKRELSAVEREISEAEASRGLYEEKCWNVDFSMNQKFKELVEFSIECNQALKRLKLGGDLHYVLNANGSTPAEVLGIDYKSTLKPTINSFAEEIKKSPKAKLEEFITLQQQYKEMTSNIETKRNRLTALQTHLDESFYLPGLVDIHDKQVQQWNNTPPPLSLWSRFDCTQLHRNIAKSYQHSWLPVHLPPPPQLPVHLPPPTQLPIHLPPPPQHPIHLPPPPQHPMHLPPPPQPHTSNWNYLMEDQHDCYGNLPNLQNEYVGDLNRFLADVPGYNGGFVHGPGHANLDYISRKFSKVFYILIISGENVMMWYITRTHILYKELARILVMRRG